MLHYIHTHDNNKYTKTDDMFYIQTCFYYNYNWANDNNNSLYK